MKYYERIPGPTPTPYRPEFEAALRKILMRDTLDGTERIKRDFAAAERNNNASAPPSEIELTFDESLLDVLVLSEDGRVGNPRMRTATDGSGCLAAVSFSELVL